MTTTQRPHKTAFITGAARRIGRAISLDLAKHGWSIAIHCNQSLDEGEELAEEVREMGVKADVVQGNLADLYRTGELIGEANELLGPMTLLINNASIFEDDGPENITPLTWTTHQNVNLGSPLMLIRDFVDQLPEGVSGNIINIIDQRVLKLTPQFLSYTLSKTGLHTATKTLAQALAPKVRVNGVAPGPTLSNARQKDEDFLKQVDATLLQKAPNLSEFGKTIRYLVETPSITGQMILLDGGQHLIWETPDVVGISE